MPDAAFHARQEDMHAKTETIAAYALARYTQDARGMRVCAAYRFVLTIQSYREQIASGAPFMNALFSIPYHYIINS